MFKILATISAALLFLILPLRNINAETKNCISQDNFLVANYVITKKTTKKAKHALTLNLWRRNGQVAIEYPESNTIELWEQSSNGKLHLIKYFMAYNKGIEFQANEIHLGSEKSEWSLIKQLVSDQLLSKMKQESEHKSACHTASKLKLKIKSETHNLTWLKDIKLVESYKIKSKTKKERWALKKTSNNSSSINNFFIALQKIPTMDYTDIGDNESDPALQKILHSGLIKHSH